MSGVQYVKALKGTDTFSNTHLSVQSMNYSWTISNFSLCSKFPKKKFCSPEFDVFKTPFELSLRFAGEEESDSEDFVVNLCKIKTDEINHYAKYKIKILCEDSSCDCDLHSQEEELLFSDKCRVGRPMVFPKKEFLLHDTLYIRCEIMVLSEGDKINFRRAIPKRKQKAEESQRVKWEKALLIYLIITAFLSLFFMIIYGPESFAEHKCKVYQNEVQKLIVDSTVKLSSIAESLNLTDIKEMTNKIIYAYAHMFNLTHSGGTRVNINKSGFKI